MDGGEGGAELGVVLVGVAEPGERLEGGLVEGAQVLVPAGEDGLGPLAVGPGRRRRR